MQRPERTTKILKMLSAGRPVTLSTFLERLEISAATFKRDLENLRLHMNVPIVWSREYRAYILNPVHPDGHCFFGFQVSSLRLMFVLSYGSGA